MHQFMKAEYIWLDGSEPTQQLRSKTKMVKTPVGAEPKLNDFPEWGYDGSSTAQATGGDSDLALRPVNLVSDPLRGDGNFLVMCEVFNSDGTPHETNGRAKLRQVLDNGAAREEPWFGFEQEYTFFAGRDPLGWPSGGYPPPQGPYYCGVGAEQVFGRDVVEAHADACMDAGLLIFGVNAEVMPGQWEFQMGFRGELEEDAGPLNVSDHVWYARWLLHRIAEDHGVSVSFECKPMQGDWNGAGMHTNFSTNRLRDAATGKAAVEEVVMAMKYKHQAHIAIYGAGLEERLTGLHETCSMGEFRHGVADRGASIRIPRHVEQKGCGYLEDRRPGANADPYVVCSRILMTICNLD